MMLKLPVVSAGVPRVSLDMELELSKMMKNGKNGIPLVKR